MSRLLLATGNRGKAAEIRRLLPEIDVKTLAELPAFDMPEEHGTTFLENARLKASAAAERFSMPVLADDSGLEVDALGGAPGVRSARWVLGSDEDRNTALLARMEGIEDRSARFVCAMSFCGHGSPVEVVGRCEGWIADTPRGKGGFGYDPIFVLPDGRHMAELVPEAKNQLSHRGKALRALLPILRAHFESH
ncbi:MAG: RdgB/HAM1 family non-canonical purine NTP pyrophosphatase [Myxococcota bacterium]